MADEAKILTQLEQDVLDLLLRGDDPVLKALREQMTVASVSHREFTGVGFYVDFVVPNDVRGTDELLGTRRKYAFGNVGARFENGSIEVGFLLFIAGGRVSMLEGYTYGDQKWPEDDRNYELFYIGGDQGDTDGAPYKEN